MSRANELRPFAVLPHIERAGFRKRRAPHNYGSHELDEDQMRLIQEQAIGVFADMTNAGFTFQEALAAVMFTGIHYAISLSKP